jgi:DNA-binding NarL/FixJ family response regulator
MPLLRLIIADDHPLLVDGLKRVLEEIPGAEVTDCVSNGAQLISSIREKPADIIFLDLHMPRFDGIEALKIIRDQFPKLKVIVFTNYNQQKLTREIKALGASGFLLKNSTSETIKEAVVSVANGNTWFTESGPGQGNIPDAFADGFMRKYQLTGRETEIICMVAKGLTTKEIASQLFLSEFTVNTHRRNICRKLNLFTPVGITNFAKAHGLF